MSDPATLANALTKQVLTLDRGVIPQQTLTMDEILEITEYARPRFGLILVSVFASVGLILVVIGLYGVTSYSVAQRQKEIGIRLALGAEPSNIRSLIVGGSARFILLGVAIGLVLASGSTRLLISQMWGVSRYDPITFTGVIALLIMVGLLASYFPSRRASHIDPATCLRSE